MKGVSVSGARARALLLVAGLLCVGRLASRAWFEGPDLDRPAPQTPRLASGRPPPLLLAIVDGLREDATRGGATPVMPFWCELAAEGASGVALTGEPTLTAACVRTLLTGRRPDLSVAARNFDAPVVKENLVQRVAEAGLRVGHAGDAAAYQLARPWYRADDVFAVPDQGPADQGGTDDRAIPFALALIDAGVDALTMHLTRPDHAGHAHGAGLTPQAPGAPSPYAVACSTTDASLRRVVSAFRARHPDAVVLLAADHGLTSRGNHGGGEPDARRAPFVLVAPVVARAVDVEISQPALASTVAAVLRVAPLPFAEAGPALELTRLLPAERLAALSAYVNVRLALAATTSAKDLSDAIAVRRAAAGVEDTNAALRRLEGEARALEEATASAHDPMEVALALALAALVALVAADPRAFRAGRWTTAALGLAVVALLAAARLESMLGTASVVAVSATVALGAREGRWPSLGAVAGLAGFVLVSAATFALVPTLASSGAPQFALVGASVAGLATWSLADRRSRDRIRRASVASPGGLLVALGIGIGLATSLRSFVDPFVSLTGIFAAITVGVGGYVALRPGARAVSPRSGTVALLATAVALLAPPTGGSSTARAAAIGGALLVAGGLAWFGVQRGSPAVARRAPARAGLVLGGLSVALAAAARLDVAPGPVPFLVALAAALAAVVAVVRENGDTALGVRLLGALALVLLLEPRNDDGTARFAVLCVAAFAAARLPVTRSRSGVVQVAALLALLRVAAFHAMGFTESLSTIDTGGGVVPGFSSTDPVTSGISASVWINVALQALRFVAPWIVLLAAAARAFERGGQGAGPGIRDLVGDTAALLTLRGAAMVLALSIWWPQAWWVPSARAVYAFAVGDVLLLLVGTALVGGLSRARRLRAS